MPTEIKPGSGCPGKYHSGRILGLCTARCTRMGGRELEPAATVQQGLASCPNFLPLAQGVVGALGSAAAGQGG